ncbi:hypothetical protein Q5P01_013934 [Channa striata]|uniref:C-type lectin domain-containing protein n=1 Tax=Channa striata TaxID=64152 RepID=A0AA88SKX3_CHASR|nr:hypothetical protein Q5P01_013934 [Channa striata]
MEPIYANPENTKTEKRCHGAVVLCLGLLTVFLLVGLIGLRVHSAELATIKSNLTELLQDYEDKVSSLTEQRDKLIDRLNTTTEELNKLQKKTCPAGWTMFKCSCYLFSTESGSWTKGRDDCRNRGSDLVVITSAEEQTFLSGFTKESTWIGLSDGEKEGTWTWVDGTPLIFKYWDNGEPNNGEQLPGGENCAELKVQKGLKWNDLSCELSQRWICEKNM